MRVTKLAEMFVLFMLALGFLGGCAQVTITRTPNQATVVTTGWPLLQGVDAVIEETDRVVGKVCVQVVRGPETGYTPQSLKPEIEKATEVVKTAKAFLGQIFPAHTYSKTVPCQPAERS